MKKSISKNQTPCQDGCEQMVKIHPSAIVQQGVQFVGKCVVGAGAFVGAGSVIEDSVIGEDCQIKSSVIEKSIIKNNVSIGPFAHIRPDSVIESNARVGNFVEIKNSVIGEGSKVSHLAYVGDAEIGKCCNIGCGAIFVNYNGKCKQKTIVGDGYGGLMVHERG